MPDQVFELTIEKGQPPVLEIDGETFQGQPVQMTYIEYRFHGGPLDIMISRSKSATVGNWMHLQYHARCTDMAHKQGYFLKGNRGHFYGPLSGEPHA